MSIITCDRCSRTVDTDEEEVWEFNINYFVGGIENDATEMVCENCLTVEEHEEILEKEGELLKNLRNYDEQRTYNESI